jgi:hypothetical protein
MWNRYCIQNRHRLFLEDFRGSNVCRRQIVLVMRDVTVLEFAWLGCGGEGTRLGRRRSSM